VFYRHNLSFSHQIETKRNNFRPAISWVSFESYRFSCTGSKDGGEEDKKQNKERK
jgi:hypothetical protein